MGLSTHVKLSRSPDRSFSHPGPQLPILSSTAVGFVVSTRSLSRIESALVALGPPTQIMHQHCCSKSSSATSSPAPAPQVSTHRLADVDTTVRAYGLVRASDWLFAPQFAHVLHDKGSPPRPPSPSICYNYEDYKHQNHHKQHYHTIASTICTAASTAIHSATAAVAATRGHFQMLPPPRCCCECLPGHHDRPESPPAPPLLRLPLQLPPPLLLLPTPWFSHTQLGDQTPGPMC